MLGYAIPSYPLIQSIFKVYDIARMACLNAADFQGFLGVTELPMLSALVMSLRLINQRAFLVLVWYMAH